MEYALKSFVMVFAFFPAATAALAAVIFFVMPFPVLTTVEMLGSLLSASLVTGFYFGRRHAVKNALPGGFALRYGPLLIPAVLILAVRILCNALIGSAPDYEADAIAAALALCYVPPVVWLAESASKKKIRSTGRRWPVCALCAALFAVLAWQAKRDFDDTLRTYYGGATTLAEEIAGDEAIVRWYWPWSGSGRLPRLGAPASLSLNGDFPTVDGSTAFVPIYSAVVNEIYQVDDKNELKKYAACSKTGAAYDRLIRGEVDLLFTFQPSDGHLAAAKDAGVELRFTPVAREAFVFFANRRNPVSDLSVEQIQDIYLKKITNWQQVGGGDKKILPFQRPEDSASQTAMLKEVMRDKKLPKPLQAEYSGTMDGLYREIALYRDQEESVGYSFRFFTQVMVQYDGRARPGRKFLMPAAPDAEPVKLLSVNGIAPAVENIRNGSYPFTEDVFAVTAGTANPHVPELIDWLLSPQGQELIEKTGYVGIY